MENRLDLSSAVTWATLSYNLLLKSPELITVATHHLVTELPEPFDPMVIPPEEVIWQTFQELMVQMLNDPHFDVEDAYHFPATVQFGVLGDGGFFIRIRSIEDGLHDITCVIFHESVSPRLSRQRLDTSEDEVVCPVDSREEMVEAMRISREVLDRIPEEYKGRDFILEKPMYPSSVEADGVITGVLSSPSEDTKLIVAYYEGSVDYAELI